MLNTIKHINVSYNDTAQPVPVKVGTTSGSVTISKSLSPYPSKFITTDIDDFDYSDEQRELEEC